LGLEPSISEFSVKPDHSSNGEINKIMYPSAEIAHHHAQSIRGVWMSVGWELRYPGRKTQLMRVRITYYSLISSEEFP
jgi:hypothetical protein